MDRETLEFLGILPAEAVWILTAVLVGLFLAVHAVWWWLCLGTGRAEWRGLLGVWALQFSVAMGILGIALSGGHPGIFALGVFFPLLFPTVLVARALQFPEFAALAFGLPIMVSGVVFALAFRRPKLKAPSFGIALSVFMVAGYAWADFASRSAMCRSAMTLGVTAFPRNSLYWSFFNTPEEFQYEIHAAFEKDAKQYGWSYREMGWYEVPATTWGEVEGPVITCAKG